MLNLEHPNVVKPKENPITFLIPAHKHSHTTGHQSYMTSYCFELQVVIHFSITTTIIINHNGPLTKLCFLSAREGIFVFAQEVAIFLKKQSTSHINCFKNQYLMASTSTFRKEKEKLAILTKLICCGANHLSSSMLQDTALPTNFKQLMMHYFD